MWSAWSACSVSCGRGQRSRQRTCEGGIPGREVECTGDTSEHEGCIEGVRAWSSTDSEETDFLIH